MQLASKQSRCDAFAACAASHVGGVWNVPRSGSDSSSTSNSIARPVLTDVLSSAADDDTQFAENVNCGRDEPLMSSGRCDTCTSGAVASTCQPYVVGFRDRRPLCDHDHSEMT